jgi:hypothetical protein
MGAFLIANIDQSTFFIILTAINVAAALYFLLLCKPVQNNDQTPD